VVVTVPLPGTRLIHPAMQAHLGPVAEGAMTATVDLYDPADIPTPVYDRDTGHTVQPDQVPAFARVPARVQSLARGQGEGVADAVGEDVITPPYLVAVPHQLVAGEGWTVQVTACPDDPTMVGRRLTVRRVAYASARIQRDLFCDDE
jgi:hypothetical protein